MLSNVALNRSYRLLFFGDMLLVAQFKENTGAKAILSFSVAGNALIERQELLDTDVTDVGIWTLACQRLVLWGSSS